MGLEQGVDAEFIREFLASAVECGLMAVVSIFPLLWVLVVWECCLSVSMCILQKLNYVSPNPHVTPV